jgi:hypothetical protein
MRSKIAVFACLFACCPALRASEPFAQESGILAVTREDQTNALKTRQLKKEVSLSEAIAVLTSFDKVTRDQYLTYAHQPTGARGTVTLKDGNTYTWEIEPGYAATVTDAKGGTTYLLHPRLTAKPAEAANGKGAELRAEHRYHAYWLVSEKSGDNEYRLLLLTRLPVAELAQWMKLMEGPAEQLRAKGTPPAPVLEPVALTIRTYKTDSIWNDDLKPLKPLGRFRDLDEKNRTVEADGARYRYEECSTADVVRLLKAPEGKEPLHRIYPPLSGMEQTARALRLLLEDQLKDDEPKKK